VGVASAAPRAAAEVLDAGPAPRSARGGARDAAEDVLLVGDLAVRPVGRGEAPIAPLRHRPGGARCGVRLAVVLQAAVDPRGRRRMLTEPVELKGRETPAVEVRPGHRRRAYRPLEDSPVA